MSERQELEHAPTSPAPPALGEITLRDLFAGLVLAGFAASPERGVGDVEIAMAFHAADIAIAIRAGNHPYAPPPYAPPARAIPPPPATEPRPSSTSAAPDG